MKFISNILVLFSIIILSNKKVETTILFKENICEWTFENLWNKRECIKLHMNTVGLYESVISLHYTMALGTYQEEVEECKQMRESDCLNYLDNTLSQLEKCERPGDSEIQKVYEYLKSYTTHFKYICNNIDCPFAKYALLPEDNHINSKEVIESKNLDSNETKKVLEETCNTNIHCVTNTREYLETLNKFNIILPDSGIINRFNETLVNEKMRTIYEEGISYLNSKKCSVQFSGTIPITKSFETIFLTLFVLLLYY